MSRAIDLAAFDYDLPRERIAQAPLAERDASKLLVLPRSPRDGAPAHRSMRDLPELLRPGDLLVLNATRVLPARLCGKRATGGAAEALLLGVEAEPAGSRYRALVNISGRLRPGIKLQFTSIDGARIAHAEIAELGPAGEVVLAFEPGVSPYGVGRAPLPPYIRRSPRDRAQSEADLDRYQTVFARVPGAVAAPTAGLHLTAALLDALAARGVRRTEVVLHVGAGTFRPLTESDLRSGRLHAERFELPADAARAVAETRARGGRVVAVGTTAARVLEAQAAAGGLVREGAGETDLFLRPGDELRVVNALLTNFHLPRSSLLLLVAAFLGEGGRERLLAAYREALARAYRFYSYGDAMWIA